MEWYIWTFYGWDLCYIPGHTISMLFCSNTSGCIAFKFPVFPFLFWVSSFLLINCFNLLTFVHSKEQLSVRYICVLRDRQDDTLWHNLCWFLVITSWQSRSYHCWRVFFLILHRKLFIAHRLDKRIRTRMLVLRSKYPALQIPDNISWPDFVLSKFDNYGDRTAIVRFFLWWIITYLSFRFSWFHIPKVDFRSQVSKNPVNKYVAEYSALVVKYCDITSSLTMGRGWLGFRHKYLSILLYGTFAQIPAQSGVIRYLERRLTCLIYRPKDPFPYEVLIFQQ